MSTDRQIKMDARSDAGLLVRRRLSRPNSVGPLASRQLIDRNETLMDLSHQTIGLVGLGYVGLPLAVEFAKKRPVIGFDMRPQRIEELRSGQDSTREVEPEDLTAAEHLTYSCSPDDLKSCGVFIVAVPTPIDRANRPDLTLLERASETVGKAMSRGDVVIYESTVYPGCTRETAFRSWSVISGLKFNEDFFVGYSPERINPGDKAHRLPTITKVTSAARRPRPPKCVDALYGSIITAGTHKASIDQGGRGGEGHREHAARPQHRADQRARDHLPPARASTRRGAAAAGTKWNFLPFRPGPGRRPLHRRRSVLPDAQGAGDRLSPRDDPRRPAHQRQHGRLRGGPSRAADDEAGGFRSSARACCAGADVQGELPRPAQLEGRST